MGTFTLIRIFLRSFKVVRVLFSFFSTVILIFLSDFNINNLITIISTIFNYTPDLFTGFFTNTYNFISNKLWPFSDRSTSSFSYTERITSTKQVIKDAILDSDKPNKEPFFSLRNLYKDGLIPEEKQTYLGYLYDYKYAILGGVAVTLAGLALYSYSSDISGYLTTLLRDILPSDSPPGPPRFPPFDPKGERILAEGEGYTLFQKESGDHFVRAGDVIMTPTEFSTQMNKNLGRNAEFLVNNAGNVASTSSSGTITPKPWNDRPLNLSPRETEQYFENVSNKISNSSNSE